MARNGNNHAGIHSTAHAAASHNRSAGRAHYYAPGHPNHRSACGIVES
jgi:hypothetical protein